jgi:DNA-binding PadR family transcriptional regulator
VADKLTQQITDALTRAAAQPGGVTLYASKSDPGLFPNTASAKPAAQKCVADELVRVVSTETKGKTARELYGLTEKGWEFLLAAVNPKQVLEDFVRVLEARQGEVGELLDTARRMADSLQGLKDAVARVLPGVCAAKIKEPTPPGPPTQKGRGEF